MAVWPALKLDWTQLDRGAAAQLRGHAAGRREARWSVVSGVFLTHDFRPDPDGNIAAFGAIVLTRPLASLAPTQSFWAERLAPAFMVAVAAALLLALFLGLRITAPLRRLAAATAAIARGNYDVRLDRRRRDEIGALNRSSTTWRPSCRRRASTSGCS